jgi:hypothetical protein
MGLTISSLSGCATSPPLTRTETVTVQVPVAIQLPAGALDHCTTKVQLPQSGSLTVGDLANWAEDLSLTLTACNQKIDSIAEALAPDMASVSAK